MGELTKVRWYSEFTVRGIEEATGARVFEATHGMIPSGEVNEYGEPRLRAGLEITFYEPPTPETLQKLDLIFMQYRRPGGTDLAAKLETLQAQVDALKAKP